MDKLSNPALYDISILRCACDALCALFIHKRSLSKKDWSAFSSGLTLDPKKLVNNLEVEAHPELVTLFRSFIKINERSI
jgi:hypothetical protein